ncbi:hypothetical protein [Candidatus Coxiella mudrowiae]|nr:hypothetical protein [Candidatus Coxiella mudrowiae]
MASQILEVLIPAPSNNPYGSVWQLIARAAIIGHRIALFCAAHAR